MQRNDLPSSPPKVVGGEFDNPAPAAAFLIKSTRGRAAFVPAAKAAALM